ncbi:MAG: T9SS type A sorting domain-containing protein [Chitinophagaceae bacterium]
MKQILLSLFTLITIVNSLEAQTCSPLGDQTSFGSNNIWTGYVYSNADLTGYIGYVNEGTSASANFDQNFGGDNATYSTNGCATTTETFSVRYKLNQNFANGGYLFTVTGDDGYRLSLDGGATWVINKWVNQGYTATTYTATLNGNVNMVLEYYENSGSNRITLNIVAGCTGTEDQSVYGTNNIWNGYVYEGVNFNTYKGLVHEGSSNNFGFDQSFGGNAVTYNTSACSITTERFSVRYRLRKSFTAGIYTFILGADDGYRMSLDGGATWVINNFTDHSYTSSSYNVTLNGSYNMVIEYYENGTHNRISFNMIQNSILPINLISFTGKQRNGGLDLTWKVSDDSNPDFFEIEKSIDGVSFQKIGTVKSTTNTLYTYTDVSLSGGNTFYRMKMTDLTGAVTYSNIVSFRTTAALTQGINVFPNIITGNSLYMETASALTKAMVIISDANGRQVNQRVIGKLAKGQISTIETSSSKLPTGMYFMQVIDGNESISVKRFIVK